MRLSCFNNVPYWILVLLFFLHLQVIAQERPSLSNYRPLLYPDAWDTTTIQKEIEQATKIKANFPDSAILLLHTTLKGSRQIAYKSGQLLSLFHLGNLYTNKALYTRAMTYYREAIALTLVGTEGKYLMASLYGNMGQAYGLQGNYEQAASFLYHAALLNSKYPSSNNGYTYLNLAAVFMNMPEIYQEKAAAKILYYLDLSEQYGKKENNPKLLAYALNNKGSFYGQQKNYEKSFFYLEETLTIADKHQLPEIKQTALVNLGEIYLDKGDYHKARNYFLKAKEISGSKNPYYKDMVDVYLAKVYFQLQEYKMAETLLLTARQNAQQLHLNYHLAEVYQILVSLYKTTGQYKEALQSQEAYKALTDQTIGQQTTDKLSQLEARYKSVQKDNEILEKKVKIDRQEKYLARQKLLTIVFATGVLLLIVLLFLLFKSAQRKQKLQQEQMRNMKQEKEIEQLKAIMDGEEKERARLGRELHDGIGSMLAAIKLKLGSIKEEQPDLSQQNKLNTVIHMLQDTAGEVRKTAHNLMPEVLNKYSLSEALVLYCDTISLHGPEIEIQTHGDWSTLDKKTELMLYRIIQELVQNIVKHAGAHFATIQLLQQGQKLSIMVEDDGHGFNTQERMGGIGLQNLQYRIQALQGNIAIMSEQGKGTTVCIEFHLE